MLSVRQIYGYYKTHGINTVVMGACFRKAEQIIALTGCDRLTISPALLEGLEADTSKIERSLFPGSEPVEHPELISESDMRWGLNEMASEKLAQGIRAFYADQQRLVGQLTARS